MKTYKYVIIGFLLLGSFGKNVNGQVLDQRSKIIVKGEADVKVVPDQVIIALTVQTNDMDIDKARSDNDAKVAAVLAMVRKLGVQDKDLQTDYVNVEPRYDYNNKEQRLTGYYVTKNITVTLKDLSKSDKLLADALKLGTNFVQSVDFKTSEQRKYQDEARIQAIRAAKEKAIALAGELGQKIKKPITIVEDALIQTTSRGNRNTTRNNYLATTGALFDTTASSDSSTIAPGQIDIKAQVTVTFEME